MTVCTKLMTACLTAILMTHAAAGGATVVTFNDSTGNTSAYETDLTPSAAFSVSGDTDVFLVSTIAFSSSPAFTNNFNLIELGEDIPSMGQAFTDSTWGIIAGGKTTSGAGIPTNGDGDQLLLHIDQTTGTADLYVNPNFALGLGGNTIAATRTNAAFTATFSNVQVRGGGSGGNSNTLSFTDNALYFGGDSPFNVASNGVPEPSTFVLAALGFAALGLSNRRRRRVRR
jgi:hypothetical protein